MVWKEPRSIAAILAFFVSAVVVAISWDGWEKLWSLAFFALALLVGAGLTRKRGLFYRSDIK